MDGELGGGGAARLPCRSDEKMVSTTRIYRALGAYGLPIYIVIVLYVRTIGPLFKQTGGAKPRKCPLTFFVNSTMFHPAGARRVLLVPMIIVVKLTHTLVYV